MIGDTAGHRELNATSERALSREEHSLGRLVEHDRRLAGQIGLLERPASDQPECETFRNMRRHRRKRIGGRGALESAGRPSTLTAPSHARRQRWRRRIAQCGGYRARRRPGACEQLLEERGPVLERRISDVAELCGQRDNTLAVEAERHIDDVPQGPQQQRGTSEQRQRQRDLCGNQREPDTRLRARR